MGKIQSSLNNFKSTENSELKCRPSFAGFQVFISANIESKTLLVGETQIPIRVLPSSRHRCDNLCSRESVVYIRSFAMSAFIAEKKLCPCRHTPLIKTSSFTSLCLNALTLLLFLSLFRHYIGVIVVAASRFCSDDFSRVRNI